MTVTFANRNHKTQVKVTLTSIGADPTFLIMGSDVVTVGELLTLGVLSPLDGYGWYEV